MKLKNVHYEYRGNDTWRIYFNDYEEKEAFKNERTDGQKPACSIKISGPVIRYYIEAKLTGSFSILRRYVKDPTNDYFSNDIWTNLVKKIEGADTDYIFDEIDLWYSATLDKCYFRICCMYGTWTESFVKYMLNSQFGTIAQANGYYDTDNAYQGGLGVRRSCCGIGFGQHKDKYGQTEERIIFTVKNFCRGEADIVKVSPWTNTFIGTNKENEKEYSWVDFKKYMQKLSSTGSDIWDIEWEYDETCPMTGTEVADKLHVYLKPLAHKRLFEEEKEEDKQLLKNITDVLSCATKVLDCSTLYYYNLYFDDKSDLNYVHLNQINRSMLDAVKGKYYIRVVSCNKELPKNISSATLVWDQEENRYSVEDFTIKGYRSEGKKVWISSNSLLWSNNDYLGRLKALTPPPVPYWVNLDEDSKIGFRQKDVDEVQKEIDEMTKKIYEKLEIKQVKDFDVDTAWYDYLTATEMARLGADFDGDVIEQIDLINRKEKEANNKEDNNMGTKFKYIENVKDIVECNTPTKDSKTRYYRVYFEKLSDMKNFSDRVMRCIMQDKGHMCYYYVTVKSCSPVIAKYKTLYFAWDNDERCYTIDWDTTGAMLLKASANFEIKMTAQVNDAQLAVWEAALGIGSQPKQKKEKEANIKEEKNMGPKDTTFAEFYRKNFWGIITPVKPTKILIQGTATIIWWSDGTKTVVKCQKGDKMDPEKGIAMCVMKKFMGTNKTGSNYLDFAKPAIKEYEAKQKAMAAARKKAADKKRRAAKKEEKGNAEA